MKIHRPLTAAVLYLTLAGCSDSAQFNESSGAKLIEAQVITPADNVPTADATDPSQGTDPSVATDGNVPTGTGPGTGGETGAGDPGAGPGTQAKPDNVEALKAACSTGVRKTLTQSIRFAETQKCNWNMNGNYGRRDAHLQAVEGQKATIELPAQAQLCELSIGSTATTIRYDDFMILTMNNQILLSSNKDLVVGLGEDKDQAFSWDFLKVRGAPVNFNADPYCLGNGSSCRIPVTDTLGSFAFSIDPNVLGKMAANSTDKKKLDFALYATGDNDDRDCWHTAFTLEFTLDYVE